MHANLAIPAHGRLDFLSLGGLVHRLDPGVAVRLGWAHGALLTTFPGDTTMATLEQVRSLARGGSARIQR
jgi:2-dehydro-3-deoxygluconokinase